MKHRSKTLTTVGIVLKRSNLGESDRIVTLLTKDQGKLTTIAKGVRKLTSSKRAYLEPGNYIKAYLVKTKSLPLLTQATLIDDSSLIRTKLSRIRQLTQLLEILDNLFVEEELESTLFKNVLDLRDQVVKQEKVTTKFKDDLEKLIVRLGFQNPNQTNYNSILDYVSNLAERPMRSFEYLHVKN